MILQFSTGGRSGAGKERGGMLALEPDMASLATGSCNFPTRVYENAPDLVDWLAAEMLAHDVKPEIEAFDLSMIFKAIEMERAGKIKGPLHVQFVMGVKNAMPVDRELLEFYVATLKRLAPDATWTGAGIGKDQLTLNCWSLELGGHCRTGLEDNVRLDQTLWRRPMRPWSAGSSSFATNIPGGRPPSPRRVACSGCGRRHEANPLSSGIFSTPPARIKSPRRGPPRLHGWRPLPARREGAGLDPETTSAHLVHGLCRRAPCRPLRSNGWKARGTLG